MNREQQTFEKGGRCPCGSDILDAPGIGPFCKRTGHDYPCDSPETPVGFGDDAPPATGGSDRERALMKAIGVLMPMLTWNYPWRATSAHPFPSPGELIALDAIAGILRASSHLPAASGDVERLKADIEMLASDARRVAAARLSRDMERLWTGKAIAYEVVLGAMRNRGLVWDRPTPGGTK